MRPEILFPLFAPLQSLDGVGPRLTAPLRKLAGPRIVDLLWLLPSGLVDRRPLPALVQAEAGSVVTVTVSVVEHQPPCTERQPYRVACADDSDTLTLVFFRAREAWLREALPPGARRLVSGRVERYRQALQMVHPDHILAPDEAPSLARFEPVYPLTEGLTAKTVLKAVAGAMARAPVLPEWQDAQHLSRQHWQGWREALGHVHAPREDADLDPRSSARRRLASDELLANQLALALVRAAQKRAEAPALEGDGRLRAGAEAALPFSLTAAQRRALAEIDADLARPRRMLRLLQGDVGSGKTVVALMAMLAVNEAGRQAALLAPTELLARQHAAALESPAAGAGVTITTLTGRDRGKARLAKLEGIAAGRSDIVVGTHALLQDDVVFAALALAVIDEQHRFGVRQRLLLAAKGRGVHVLAMTATPIPRTLQMTAYGDLDVSLLDEKPAGRMPVTTRALPLSRLAEVQRRVRHATGSGHRAYWLCPMVEESEDSDLAAAEARFHALREAFGDRVGLVHGRQKAAERDAVMTRFVGGELQVLVATTVIEVGVDVPEATIMVVEHAERFGLAQLHQLRGRVGRGRGASYCLLLYASPLGAVARARIDTLRRSDDGFLIAEEDLRLRGAGELLGTRQSGLPAFRVADPVIHRDLLEAARDDARLILARDPELASERGRALRVLLYLFERDAAVRLLSSG